MDKLGVILKIFKASFWKVVFGFLTLIFLILIASIFTQGSKLSENAFKNAQRLVLPLQADVPIIGTRIKVELKEMLKPKTDELAIAPIPNEPMEQTEETPTPVSPKGEIADLTGATPQTNVPDVPSSDTKMVMSETFENALNKSTENASVSTPPITVDKQPHGKALASAPTEELSEKIGDHMLPKISDDGLKPWKFYGKPFDDNEKPLIAIIVRGLGLGRITTENALNLDSNVTLSFSPYAKNTQMWSSHARNICHEIMLDLPQETKNYPADDPGPYALLNTLDEETNIGRLHAVMGNIAGYVGFLQTDNPAPQTTEVMNSFKELANRGVFLVESPHDKQSGVIKHQQQMGLITQTYSHRIDDILNTQTIKDQLDLLVKQAKKNGVAIGVTLPYPLSLELINAWSKDLDKMGVTLAPISAIVDHEL